MKPLNVKNKAVCVVGLGRSGFAAAKFLLEKGARVRVTEGSSKQEALERAEYLKGLGAQVETGGHTDAFIDGADWVVVSPGVPKTSAPLVRARQTRRRVISEIELAYFFCPGRIVAVTGSNGKTTTCHLLYRMARQAGRQAVLCGNVGFSFLDALSEVRPNTLVVLELSSFQLEDSPTFRPHVSVVLNISPNHLDRHGSMGAYARAKENIFRNQKGRDVAIFNQNDAWTRRMAKKARCRVLAFAAGGAVPKGMYEEGGAFYEAAGARPRRWMEARELTLKGRHNVENVLAAAAAARACGVPLSAVREAARGFQTLEHRIEPLGEINGVRFVNDSKSTTVASTRAAIEAVQGPLVLVAGGRPKGASFADVEPLLLERARHVVLYGEARGLIGSSWPRFSRVSSELDFERAVERAFDEARPGDTVLLSPMCTSFDQFTSFEARGEAFKRVFARLAGAARPAASGA